MLGDILLAVDSGDLSVGPGVAMGAGTGGAGWASAHPGKNQGGHGPPWKF